MLVFLNIIISTLKSAHFFFLRIGRIFGAVIHKTNIYILLLKLKNDLDNFTQQYPVLVPLIKHTPLVISFLISTAKPPEAFLSFLSLGLNIWWVVNPGKLMLDTSLTCVSVRPMISCLSIQFKKDLSCNLLPSLPL